MRKIKLLVMTLALSLMLAAPAFAFDNVGVATVGGNVAVNSFNNNVFRTTFNRSFNTFRFTENNGFCPPGLAMQDRCGDDFDLFN